MEQLSARLTSYLGLINSGRLPVDMVLKDLRHLAFWLQHYADTLLAIDRHEKPITLKGTYANINKEAERLYASKTKTALIREIRESKRVILRSAERIPVQQNIRYKRGVSYVQKR